MKVGHLEVEDWVKELRHVLAAVGLVLLVLATTAPAAAALSVPELYQDPASCPAPPSALSACHMVIKPKTWIWTGDGSAYLYDLQWTKWGDQGASGTGVLLLRTGVIGPAKNYHRFPVEVLAQYPVTYQGHYILAVVSTFPLHSLGISELDFYMASQTVPDFPGS